MKIVKECKIKTSYSDLKYTKRVFYVTTIALCREVQKTMQVNRNLNPIVINKNIN